MAQAENVQSSAAAEGAPAAEGLPRMYYWMIGVGAVVIVMLVCLLVWGPNMDYPTTVSTREVAAGAGTVTLDRSLREVTGGAIDDGVNWVVTEGRWLFSAIETAIEYTLIYLENTLKWIPWPAMVAGISLMAFAVGRWGLTAFTAIALLFMGFMGLWENTLDTLALMVVAVCISVAVGLPLGVIAARNQLADGIMRPILDAMQTMPSFVYLLPALLLFGLGKPAGIFATLIYAVPPVIRLTNLGIRQVSHETVEAARSFGASPWQVLTKVQVPMALPTIMAGINQTTMMALAMVTIASMVAAGGLGDNVLRALQKNEAGNGLISGLAIVFLAIIIDRLTQAVAAKRQEALSAG